MAFYIHTTEIDKAQAVGQRALQTISFRLIKCKALNFNIDFVIVLRGYVMFWKPYNILMMFYVLRRITL